MGCGCGRNKPALSQGALLRGEGGYLTLHYGDNGVAYGGDHADEQVIIVARNTPDEKVFTKDDLVGASAYARSVRKTLIIQPASLLPAAAMESLFSPDVLDAGTTVPVEEEGDEEETLQFV